MTSQRSRSRAGAVLVLRLLGGLRRRLVYRLQLEKRRETLRTELASEAAGLHAAERARRVEHVVVDADAAGLHTLGHGFATLVVVRPHAAAEPELGVVGHRDGLI